MTSHKLIDTHSHIDMPEIDLKKALLNAAENNVQSIILPSVDRNSFQNVLKISKENKNVYAALGIHPTEANFAKDEDFSAIFELAKTNKVIAIGECGLDYYWDKTFAEKQKEIFIKQILIANELNLPILVHDREAHKDTFDLLVEYSKNIPVVMHCFSGSPEFAKMCVNKGFYLGIGGVITFKNAKKLHEVVKTIPLEHILLETDAPYLAPVPYRGKVNEPAFVKYVAEEIAKIKETSFEQVADITTENAYRIFDFV